MWFNGATCEELPKSNMVRNKGVSSTLKTSFPQEADGVTKSLPLNRTTYPKYRKRSNESHKLECALKRSPTGLVESTLVIKV